MDNGNSDNRTSDISKVAKFERYHSIVFFSLFSVILISFIILLVCQYLDHLDSDSNALGKDFQSFANEKSQRFSQIQHSLDTIRYSAEYDLFETKHSAQNMPLSYRFMKQNHEKKFFHLDDVDNKYKNMITANLTGNGTLEKNKDPDSLRRIHMYLSLMDDFEGFKQRIPNVIYLYSISIDRTLLQFPWLPSSEYKFEDKLYDYDVWKNSLPENNPQRKTYWTDAYLEYGGGLMTSCAVPVYDDDKFVCIIAADVSVDFLNEVSKTFEPARGGVIIVYDSNQNILAHPGLISSKDSSIRKLSEGLPAPLASELKLVTNAQDNVIHESGKWRYLKYKFPHSPFTMLYIFPKQSFWNWATNKIGFEALCVVAFLFFLISVFLIITHRKLVSPSEKLVNYILAKSRENDITINSKIPEIWKPWFYAIQEVFDKKVELTESLKIQNAELEKKNIMLLEEIGARNKAEEENKVLQKQLIQEEKLKGIGMLAGGIAHDFNNQLAVIMGYASILLSPARLGEEKYRQCLEQILSATTISADLTKQLLAFARKGNYQNVPVNLHGIIANVVSILNHAIDKRISINIEPNASLYTAMGDPSQLQAVIMNIAINAKNAMPNGGMITFKTANNTISAEAELAAGNYIDISITDTGIGIDDETKKHIFEPFFTTNNSGIGTGLGLAAAFGIIKNHKGEIAVKSIPGIGTTFIITIPVSEENTVLPKSSSPVELRTVKFRYKLLLIDDEDAFCRMVTDFMGSAGYQIKSYSDPFSGIEYYKNNWSETDIVIIDMMMPKINGKDLLTELKRINPDIRIIVSSGYNAEEEMQDLLCNEDRIIAFSQKPFSLIQFANDISKILEDSK